MISLIFQVKKENLLLAPRNKEVSAGNYMLDMSRIVIYITELLKLLNQISGMSFWGELSILFSLFSFISLLDEANIS